jgi:DNA-3-methyladenine glycosylase II
LRIIIGPEDVAEGADWLAKAHPRFAYALEQVGELPLRRQEGGYGALLSAIVGQQVSIASAAAIRGRVLKAGYGDPAIAALASEEELRACGLSRPKARYVSALARADLDYAGLEAMADEQVVKTLVALPGIGVWTAEIYAMFALGRADVLAAGDLALQEGARALFGLNARPDDKALRAMAVEWSPWRSVAARILWAYYRVAKGREGILA